MKRGTACDKETTDSCLEAAKVGCMTNKQISDKVLLQN